MNQDFTVILAIPARLDSTRLPRKLVAEIGGKPMLGHVLERCLQATAAHIKVLCTDSQELADQAAGDRGPLRRVVANGHGGRPDGPGRVDPDGGQYAPG